MCESHTHGNTSKESNVNDIKSPWILWWAKNLVSSSTKETEDTIASTLDTNIIDVFLSNKDQRNHFENLNNKEAKLKYITNIITSDYAKKLSNEYKNDNIQEAKKLELEMGSYIAAAAQIVFGNTTNWEA